MKRITWLAASDPPGAFPPVDRALDEPPGLLAAGGDLSAERLLEAYRRGIFPWYSPGQPVLWWSPDPREVLFPAEFHCSRSLARARRNRSLTMAFDRDFDAVLTACAAPRESGGGTWITPAMRSAYNRLHTLGVAHSIEVRRGDTLVGGLYGVSLGSVFFGESMFSRERDGSKVAMAHLVDRADDLGIALIDCQLASAHLRSLGSRPLPRAQFMALLSLHAAAESRGHWT
jgi:leucyl/phenylalanyl-tRNA--protein transferase